MSQRLTRKEIKQDIREDEVRSALVRVFDFIQERPGVVVGSVVGFVGLITPHLIRRVGGADHRVLLPAAVLLGGSVLVLADTAARTLISPMQLPVGVLTAMIGVPVFLFLLYRRRPG